MIIFIPFILILALSWIIPFALIAFVIYCILGGMKGAREMSDENQRRQHQ